MFLPLDPASHAGRQHGPFKIRRIHPGAMLDDPADGGWGGLGLIDLADLTPGLKVAMHEHRNDEIISYLRHGEMVHRDSTGVTESVRPDRLMVMNAGSGFQHEETVPGPEHVRMLQIFVRPSESGMRPGVQFHDLAAARSDNAWRLLVGPPGADAAATVRQRLFMHDARLRRDATLSIPFRKGFDGWLYVFDGNVTVGGRSMTTHDAMGLVDETDATIAAQTDSDIVLFLVDRTAPATRAGTLSGQ